MSTPVQEAFYMAHLVRVRLALVATAGMLIAAQPARVSAALIAGWQAIHIAAQNL